MNEWVFDNANSTKLEAFIRSTSPQLAQSFQVNVKQIDWHPFAMNHAYGVKHYVLKEEAVIPSLGYGDALVHLKQFGVRDWAPWTEKVNWYMNTRSHEDMKRMVLETNSVKEAIGEIVASKLAYYKNTLNFEVDENKIYQDVKKEASSSMDVIMADYNPGALKTMCHSLTTIFKRIYEKIVVNEKQL